MAQDLDEELAARQEAEALYRQEELERRRQQDRRGQVTNLAKQQIKRAGKKVVKKVAKRAVVAILPWLWAAFLAALPFILIGILVLLVIFMAIFIICDPSSLGVLGYIVSLGNTLTGIVPDYVCEAIGGAAVVVTNVVESGVEAMCSTPEIIAQQNGTAFPFNRNSQQLIDLMACIESKPGMRDVDGNPLWGSRFTFEERDQGEPVNQTFCNYTRGQPMVSCGVNDCAHSVNSCHYGGGNGSNGAEAVDYGNEAIASQLIQAAQVCNAGFWLNEGNHVHISTRACGSDGGDN